MGVEEIFAPEEIPHVSQVRRISWVPWGRPAGLGNSGLLVPLPEPTGPRSSESCHRLSENHSMRQRAFAFHSEKASVTMSTIGRRTMPQSSKPGLSIALTSNSTTP